MIIVFDIDGTVADVAHRLHWIETKPKNWPAFYGGIPHDPEIEPLANLARELAKEHTLVYCTGRDEKYRASTKAWLAEHGMTHQGLYMRPDHDHRIDSEVKHDLVQRIWSEHGRPDLVFEDRQRNVDMFRSLGLICLQVAKGDY